MDQDRFDDITKALATGADRRSMIKRLAGGVLGGVLALGAGGADARRRRRPRVTCLVANSPCSTTTGKPCCAGLTCGTGAVCVVSTSPPPPPAICGAAGLGGRCNPKSKTSCGTDSQSCECTLVVDSIFPKVLFHYECAAVKLCRATFESCTVGAPAESRFDCCSASDYCKQIEGAGRQVGFCKAKPTCPSPGNLRNICNKSLLGKPCGTADSVKGCFCDAIPNPGSADGVEFICRFRPDCNKTYCKPCLSKGPCPRPVA